MNRSLGRLLMLLVKSYQILVSPLLIGNCRFYPSCSEYSAQAFCKHGALRGIVMTLKRIGRCHPGHPGGYDPVD